MATKEKVKPIQAQYNMLGFLLAYPGDEIPFDSDESTVEAVCGLVNLGVASAHFCDFLGGGLMTLRSEEKGKRLKNHLESAYELA